MKEKQPSVFTPAKIGNLTLRNRVLRTAAFEGMCQGGEPTEALIEHHREMARGGVSMTTVAYCSVSFDGRTFDHQMYMREEIVPSLKRLTDAVHREGGAASIQLGHAGYFASKKVIAATPLGPSRVLNLYGLSFPREMTESDMERVMEDFGQAAELAAAAGFDAVEVHAGHGYLLSQFLSPYTNRRTDQYGGSIENRMRFPLQVVRHVSERLGPGFPILVKMNLSDGFKGGLTLDDAIVFAKNLETNGADALVLLGGICSIDHMETAMEEGFEFVAMGRALIEDPHLINKIKSGKARESKCDQCNKCIVEMDRGGVRCVLG